MLGRLLGGRYQVEEQLGEGGMALVYKGRDTLLSRTVTVKVLRPEFTSDNEFIRRFRKEAQAIASLSHPNIVSIYDVGQEEELKMHGHNGLKMHGHNELPMSVPLLMSVPIHYLVMEYIEGESLKELIKRKGSLPVVLAVSFAVQICNALEHAHGKNIVHRDVKSHNILITTTGQAKLTDFGIAREVSTSTITYNNTALGSVHYVSPEQARGEPAGPSSDLYSLGVILYEMLTGIVPFNSDSPVAVALKHIREQPALLTDLKPSIPLKLERIVKRAMNKDPEKRFSAAHEFERELRAVVPNEIEKINGYLSYLPEAELTTEEYSERNVEESNVVLKKVRRRPRKRLWIIILLLIMGLLGGAFFALYRYLNVAEVKVPDVTGMPLEAARAVLLEKGLSKVSAIYSYNSVQKDWVIAQNIGPEDPIVKVTRAITLTVSRGPEFKKVPDLYRKNLADAKIILQAAGFELEEPVQKEYNKDVPEGLIFKQKPEHQVDAPKGSKVTLFISQGPKPVLHSMPDLVGLSLEQVRSTLGELKLKLDENFAFETSFIHLQNQVISQSIPKGTEIEEGTVIKLTLSRGPGPAACYATVQFFVINDGQEHEVKIIVRDIRGSTVAYLDTHLSGDEVMKEVKYYDKATVQVYIDNRLVEEKTLD